MRGQDSINTFREILEIARDAEVDFILLGGDLFHENRPSRSCLHQTIALLREYTLGDKPISVSCFLPLYTESQSLLLVKEVAWRYSVDTSLVERADRRAKSNGYGSSC